MKTATACFLSLALVGQAARAGTFDWTGSSSSLWTTAGNWTLVSGTDTGGDGIPNAGEAVNFLGTAVNFSVNHNAATDTNYSNFVINSTTAYTFTGNRIRAGAFSVTGGSGHVIGNFRLGTAGQNLQVDGGAGVRFNALDLNNGRLNKTGDGTLIVNTSDPVNIRGINIAAGTLDLWQSFSMDAGDSATNHALLSGVAGTTLTNTTGTTRILTLGNTNTAARSATYAGTITGNLGLSIGGATNKATQTLSGSNTYSGGTTITNNGVLLATNTSGSATGSGAVTVNTGGTLGGNGSISGPVTVNGTLAPGTSPGTLTLGSSLTLAPSTILDYELNGTNNTVGAGINDLVTGITNLVLDGTLNVTPLGSFASATAGTKWRLFNYTGTLTDNVLNLGTMPTLGPGLSFVIDTATAGQVNLAIVPEPGSLVLAGLGGLLIVARRRRA